MEKKVNTETYADWNDKPFNLTLDEIKNPSLVLENFCWLYSTTEARTILKDWYAASLSDDNANSKSIFTMYENVEKLIEAVYLIDSDYKIKRKE